MKKRFLKLLIVFSFLFCLSTVGASDCVSIDTVKDSGVSVGNYKYRYWDKTTWETTIKSAQKTSAYVYDTSVLAARACTDAIKQGAKIECRGTDSISKTGKYYCYGQSYPTAARCKAASYTLSGGNCTYQSNGKCSKVLFSSKYKCSLNSVKYDNQSICNAACKTYQCSKNKRTYIGSSSCYDNCKGTTYSCKSNNSYCKGSNTYKYAYKYVSVSTIEHEKSTLKDDGFGALNIFHYTTKNGDTTYCIQPGKRGPQGNKYCLNEVFDLSRCKTENHYFCGLADILYQTVKEDGTYSDGTVKFVDNGKYGYAEITTALRMWVAYTARHGSKSSITLGDNGIITGIEDAKLQYVSNTNVYADTADQAKAGYMGLACDKVGFGVLCGQNDKYVKAIQLFKHALEGKNEFVKYEVSSNNTPETSHTSITEGGEITFTITTKIPETFQEKMVDCTKEELLNKKSGCKVFIELKDKDGKTVNNQIQSAECQGKETCEIVVKAQRKQCSVSGGTIDTPYRYKLNIGLKGYSRGGYVRQYVNAAGAEVSQVMMTFAFNEKRFEVEGGPGQLEADSNSVYTHELEVPCYCDPTKYCDDFRAKGALKPTCAGYGTQGAGAYDTYEKSTYEDPYMNCILNACDPNKKEEFSYTKETGANSKVCNIYCRKELTFYLANKTKVYAGMQFSYDIASKVLQGEGDIEKVLTTNHKLTSIVLQKRQCTSEIYYNKKNSDGKTWIEQYDAAVKNMIDAYNDWKKIEVLYDWEVDNGGPHKITAKAKDTRTGSGTCGNTKCGTKSGACPALTIHTWPKYDYKYVANGEDIITPDVKYYNTWKINSSCKANSNGEVSCANSKANVLPNNEISGEPNVGVSGCGSSGCRRRTSCSSCGSRTVNGKTVCKTCYTSSYSTTRKCKPGSEQTKRSLENEENAAWISFKAAVKVVEQLYYDLQNCNFYVDSSENRAKFSEKINYYYTDLKGEHHKNDTSVSPNKSTSGSIKDFLLGQAYCKTKEECVSLILSYEDDYGTDTEFSKNVGNVDSRLNNNYYCKNNGSKTKCYEYKQDEEVEIENTNKTAKHDRIVCSGVGTSATCKSVSVYLPTNDYATFITVTEADFWQPKSYKTSVYTGIVSEDDGSASAGDSTPLGKEVFPVSNKTRKDKNGKDIGSTGSYDVKHKYSNLGLTSNDKFDFEYACNYEVYNTTKYYDCETNENGVTDLTKCKNPCYELKDGVPVITDSCDIWTPKDNNSKSYGFIYRNVDVGNLFPGENIRDTGINWSNRDDVINAIQNTADTIYTTDDYLEYRYVLTPSNIRQIREYNSSQNSNGGYLNETLSNCKMVDSDGGLKSFTECQSSFLKEVKNGKFGDIKVSGSKS